MDIAKFFERKKRKLSTNNSTEEEASLKKPREENPDDSMGLDTDDVFFTKSPKCVKILFNCLQNLETEMKSVKETSLAAKDWQIKGTEQLNDITKPSILSTKNSKNLKKIWRKKKRRLNF